MKCLPQRKVKLVYAAAIVSIFSLFYFIIDERIFRDVWNFSTPQNIWKPIKNSSYFKLLEHGSRTTDIISKFVKNTSYFILSEQEFTSISLKRGCSKCPVVCPNNLKNLTSCKGDACLCFQLNPLINLQKFSNNSKMLSEKLLPQEIRMLDDKKVLDVQKLPSPSLSTLKFLAGHSNIFAMSENISLILQLNDGHGTKLNRGGDDIRVKMEDKNKTFAIAGRAVDYHNGTYSIYFPTLWSGTNVVSIYVPYYREERSAYLRWMRQFNAVWLYKSRFVKEKETQSTICAARPNIVGYDRVCNMTYENGDNAWYCGHPLSDKLTCLDLQHITDYGFIDLPIMKGEEYLRRKGDTHRLFKQITLLVKGDVKYGREKLPPCGANTVSKSWDLALPSGYTHKGFYYPTYCRINQTNDDIKSCLTNTTIIFSGDSTTREWYVELINLLGCKLTTKDKVWHTKSMCFNRKTNLEMKWNPNTLPWSDVWRSSLQDRVRATSISMLLDDAPAKGKVIFVIHIYAATTRHHYNVVRDKLRKLLPALRRALERNHDLFVAVKGPHTFIQHNWMPGFNDFIGPFIESILMEEFREFRDRVVYLDIWDMCLAYGNKDIHPPEPMKWNMLRLLFAYSCPNL